MLELFQQEGSVLAWEPSVAQLCPMMQTRREISGDIWRERKSELPVESLREVIPRRRTVLHWICKTAFSPIDR